MQYKQVNEEVSKEVERIYLEGWSKGIAIPFWDNKGNFYLANPDGSEDLVEFNQFFAEAFEKLRS